MKLIVLGAGLAGIAAAWYLAEDGHQVTVVERQPGPALETSFANGGQLSTSHAEPWANPGAPRQVLQWLGREDAPLLWRMRADAAQWAWGLRFALECLPFRADANTRAVLALALDSRQRLRELRQRLQLQYDQQALGILHLYFDPRELQRARPMAELLTRLGCERRVLSAAECVAREPALAQCVLPLAGATFGPGDESGDAHAFTVALAEQAAARGVVFRFGAPVARLRLAGGRVGGIDLADGETLATDGVVVALGSYSPLLVRPLGIRLPIYPVKGYSITLPLDSRSAAPQVSLTDESRKLVFSRLGQRLRVAGTAELNGYDQEINPVRCAAILQRTLQLFPHLQPAGAPELWTGLRPATPGNVPTIGATRVPGLWVNSGHGTLGWTLACGSGRLLADIVAGRPPAVQAFPYRPD